MRSSTSTITRVSRPLCSTVGSRRTTCYGCRPRPWFWKEGRRRRRRERKDRELVQDDRAWRRRRQSSELRRGEEVIPRRKRRMRRHVTCKYSTSPIPHPCRGSCPTPASSLVRDGDVITFSLPVVFPFLSSRSFLMSTRRIRFTDWLAVTKATGKQSSGFSVNPIYTHSWSLTFSC